MYTVCCAPTKKIPAAFHFSLRDISILSTFLVFFIFIFYSYIPILVSYSTKVPSFYNIFCAGFSYSKNISVHCVENKKSVLWNIVFSQLSWDYFINTFIWLTLRNSVLCKKWVYVFHIFVFIPFFNVAFSKSLITCFLPLLGAFFRSLWQLEALAPREQLASLQHMVLLTSTLFDPVPLGLLIHVSGFWVCCLFFSFFFLAPGWVDFSVNENV